MNILRILGLKTTFAAQKELYNIYLRVPMRVVSFPCSNSHSHSRSRTTYIIPVPTGFLQKMGKSNSGCRPLPLGQRIILLKRSKSAPAWRHARRCGAEHLTVGVKRSYKAINQSIVGARSTSNWVGLTILKPTKYGEKSRRIDAICYHW